MIFRLKTKTRSQGYDINKPKHSRRHKYTKYKVYLSMVMVVWNKQHPSNIWSSIHEKVKQQWGWDEKKSCL